MGFGNLLEQLGPKRVRLGRKSTYMLTPLGTQRVEDESGHGNDWQVMSHLYDNPQSTLSDIQSKVNFSDEQTKRVVKRLIDSNYVKKVVQEV